MKQNISSLFKDLKWYESTEYLLLLGVLITIPFAYHIAIWLCYAHIFFALCCRLFTRKQRSVWSTLDSWSRWSFITMGIFWFVMTASLLWTRNLTHGLQLISVMLPILLEGVCFASSKPTLFTTSRIRGALNIFTFTLFILFAARLGFALHKLVFKGTSLAGVWGANFYKLHHAYIALYLLAGMSYVSLEAVRLWYHERCRWWFVLLLLSFYLFITIVNSRAGILCAYSLCTVAIIWFTWQTRRWRNGIIIGVLTAGFIVGLNAIIPEKLHRLGSTIESTIETVKKDSSSDKTDKDKTNEKSVPKEDARISIFKCGFEALKKQPIVGYGIGDVQDHLDLEYKAYGFKAKEGKLNNHDQYMESILAAGLAGLLSLIALLATATIALMRRNVPAGWMFVGIMAINLIFESMFYRELGIIPYIFLTSLFLLLGRRESDQSVKSLSRLSTVDKGRIAVR